MKLIVKVFYLFSIMLFIGCGSSENYNISSTTIEKRLSGTWEATFDNQCIETTVININGTSTVYSLDEIQTGTYQVDTNTYNGKYKVTFSVDTDNGLPDCNGISDDDSGSEIIVYIKFLSDTELESYLTEEDSSFTGVNYKQ